MDCFSCFCTSNIYFSNLKLTILNNFLLRIICLWLEKNNPLWRKKIVFEKSTLQFSPKSRCQTLIFFTFFLLQRLIFKMLCLRIQRKFFCASFGGNHKKNLPSLSGSCIFKNIYFFKFFTHIETSYLSFSFFSYFRDLFF